LAGLVIAPRSAAGFIAPPQCGHLISEVGFIGFVVFVAVMAGFVSAFAVCVGHALVVEIYVTAAEAAQVFGLFRLSQCHVRFHVLTLYPSLGIARRLFIYFHAPETAP
jgi:hypothetical protein